MFDLRIRMYSFWSHMQGLGPSFGSLGPPGVLRGHTGLDVALDRSTVRWREFQPRSRGFEWVSRRGIALKRRQPDRSGSKLTHNKLSCNNAGCSGCERGLVCLVNDCHCQPVRSLPPCLLAALCLPSGRAAPKSLPALPALGSGARFNMQIH